MLLSRRPDQIYSNTENIKHRETESLTFTQKQLLIRLARLVVAPKATVELQIHIVGAAEIDRVQVRRENWIRGTEVGGERLPLGADGGQFALGETEDGGLGLAVADVRLRLLCGCRSLEENRPGRSGPNGREREGLEECYKGLRRDHTGRRGRDGGGKEGDNGGEEDGAWGVHCG